MRRLAARLPALLRALVGALLAGLLAAGCAGMPTSGPVRSAGSLDDPLRVVRSCPPGPFAGQDPTEVVIGFLRAASCFDDEHAVAREFLVAGVRQQWRADASVTAYPDESSLELTTTGGDESEPAVDGARAEVVVSTGVAATVDLQGRLAEAGPGEQARTSFGLVRRDGAWRIERLEDGLLLPVSQLQRVYAPLPLWFGSPSRDVLVPDARWFPQLEPLPTALVRALLQGPVGWLEEAVVTGAPPGTSLLAASVPVVDGVAVVDLSADVLDASADERLLLVAQLQATLQQLPQVRDVAVLADGAVLEVPGVRTREVAGQRVQARVVERFAQPVPEGRAVVLTEAGVARLDVREVVPVDGLDALAVPGAEAVGTSRGGEAYGVLVDQRSRLLVAAPGTPARELAAGADLTPPSFDVHGWVWSSPALGTGGEGGGSVLATRFSDGLAVDVAAPWTAGRRLLDVRVSADAARALVRSQVLVGEEQGRVLVEVVGVVREPDGTPRALSEPQRLSPSLVGAQAVSWVGVTDAAVLASPSPDAPLAVHLVGVGGLTAPVDAAPLPAATGLAGTTPQDLLAEGPDGVLVRAGATWVPLGAAARDPSYPG